MCGILGPLDLKDIASLIETGAYAREVRRIARAVRLTMALRKKLKASTLNAFLNFILSPGSEVHSRLSSYLPKVNWFNNYFGLGIFENHSRHYCFIFPVSI